MRTVVTTLAILWASPGTLIGLVIGALGLLSGGHVGRAGRVLEFWGGFVTWFLRVFPLVSGASAVTFGHTVLGRSAETLDSCRRHELIHVRQYERWGPFFIPAYLVCWLVLWLCGRNPYFDNPFEREAFENSG